MSKVGMNRKLLVSITSAGYWPPVRASNETIPTEVDN